MKKKRLLQLFVCLILILIAGLVSWKVSEDNISQLLSRITFKETRVLKEADIKQAYENVLCSAVKIQGNGHYGSGSIYCVAEDKIVIVTVGHVLAYYDEEGCVTFFDGKRACGEILGVNASADVGFIGIPLEDFTSEELLSYHMVRKRDKVYSDLKKNDCFFMIDLASDTQNPIYYEGGIIDKNKSLEEFEVEMLYGDGYAVPGMSGCGVFDEYGNYIALLAGGTEQGEIAAVPLGTIEEVYQSMHGQ